MQVRPVQTSGNEAAFLTFPFMTEGCLGYTGMLEGLLKTVIVTCAVTMTPGTTDGEKLKFHTLNRKTGHRLVIR